MMLAILILLLCAHVPAGEPWEDRGVSQKIIAITICAGRKQCDTLAIDTVDSCRRLGSTWYVRLKNVTQKYRYPLEIYEIGEYDESPDDSACCPLR